MVLLSHLLQISFTTIFATDTRDSCSALQVPHVLLCGSMELPQHSERVAVFWPGDDKWFTGTIAEVSSDPEAILRPGCRPARVEHKIHYDDGDRQWHELNKERWRRLDREVVAREYVDLHSDGGRLSRVPASWERACETDSCGICLNEW